MDRIALVIPATPVPLVARAALDLHCEATEGELAARVHELRSRLDELSVPTALGREFDPQRAARADLQADLDRNRDLLRVESDVLASEEAEQIVRIGLERLCKRRALSQQDGRIELGDHPHARELLEYYSRSLAALTEAESRSSAPIGIRSM